MSSDNIAIRVSNLSKCYQIYENPHDRLKQFVLPRFQRLTGQPVKQYFRDFWALNNVSLEIRKGETVGIIGRNGSGKSTLLQLICGTLTPTNGTVETRGRIAALLELGSGFNPEFTGRENVYMNAALLGLSKEEVDARFDDIVAFADIGEFIERPVKMYSSGMAVRLAFAVQSQIDPEILVVDEALSVGDAKFQAKCFDRLKKLKDNGTSILLVTHSGEQIVTHCSKAVLLDNGSQVEAGEPRRVVNRYMDLLFGRERKQIETDAGRYEDSRATPPIKRRFNLNNQEDVFSTRSGYNKHEYRWGDGTAAILDYYLAADNEPYPSVITTGQVVHVAVMVRFYADLFRPILGIVIKTKEGVTVYGANSEMLECTEFQNIGQKETFVQAEAHFNCRLAAGDYFISFGIATRHGEDIVPHDRRYDSVHFIVGPSKQFFGLADLDLKLAIPEAFQ